MDTTELKEVLLDHCCSDVADIIIDLKTGIEMRVQMRVQMDTVISQMKDNISFITQFVIS